MSSHMKESLVKQALSMANSRRKSTKGLIHHSDQRSHYASYEYQLLLKSYAMISSISKKGDCWENAVAESFFHSLKTEWIRDTLVVVHVRGLYKM